MTTQRILAFLLTGLLGWFALACDPNPSLDPSTGPLSLTFDNVVGGQDLRLGSTYRNGSGESFTPKVFTYYISNLRLTRADGSEYVVPVDSSYFLLREDVPASQRITLNAVPYGEYKAVSFMIGVDSLRSTMSMDRRTGVLDPGADHNSASGMFWAWNSGYIFVKLEGESPSAPADATGSRTFRYHIGLFGAGGTLNNTRTVRQLPFGNDRVTVAAGTISTVNLQTDVLKIFDGPTPLSIAAHPQIMLADFSKYVANNYAQMVRYKDVTTTATK